MSNAPMTYEHYDAPEAYNPPPSHYAPAPNSPPPQYPTENTSGHPDARYSTYKPGFAAAPVPMSDAENQAAASGAVGGEPKRLRDRKMCGCLPFLWFLALLALLVVAAIVGGTLGGVLGSKKDNATAPPDPTPPIPSPPPVVPIVPDGPITTTSISSSTTSAKPTNTAVFVPKVDSWYYMRNDRLDPSTILTYENFWSATDQQSYWSITESRGDPFEHWAFWPAKRNSTGVETWRKQVGITSDIYIMYNRGMMQLPNTTAPSQETLDELSSWWWFEPHEETGYSYVKGAWVGTEFAFTIFDTGETGSIDDQYDLGWNRTAGEAYADESTAETFKRGQAWKMELAFEFSESDMTLWDLPPAQVD